MDRHLDSTELETLRVRLAAAERSYRHLLDSAPESVFLVAADGADAGRILDANEPAAASHGYSRQELLAMRISDLNTELSAFRVPERLRSLVKEESARFEVEHHRKDGSIFPVEVSARLIDVNGRRCILAFDRDITQRKQLQQLEQEHRLRLELAARAGGVGYWDWDIGSGQVFFSTEWKRQLGHEDHEVSDRFAEWQGRVHPDDLAHAMTTLQSHLESGGPGFMLELRLRHKDGSYRWIQSTGELVRGADGKPRRMLGCHVDVTARKEAEAVRREGQERFEALVRASAEIVWTANVDGSVSEDSASWRAFTGQTFDELRGFGWLEAIHPDDRERTAREWADTVRTGKPIEIEYRVRRVGGGWRWTAVRGVPLLRQDGTVRLWVGMNKDITERKQAEEALHLARFTIDRASVAIFWVRSDASLADVNEAACESVGFTREELLRMKVADIDLNYSLEAWPAHWSELRQRKSLTFISRKRRKDGTEFDVEINANWMTFDGEELNCAFVQDITERLRAERAFRLEAERIAAIYSTEPECIKTVSLDGRLLELNPAGLRMVEASSLQQVIGRPVVDFIHPGDAAHFMELHRKVAGGGTGTLEFRLIGIQGTVRWMETHSVPLRDGDGGISSVLSVIRDITLRREAESERHALSERLQQSNKMEAVGTLAGGIAHDFNNILGAILGYLDIARMDLRDGLPVEESLGEIRKAADRARALVRQILTFSRQDPHEREVIELQPIVSEAARFLRATISTVATIEVRVEPEIPHVMADANQIHQVVVNLCTNAWHALEDRPGTITIGLTTVGVTADDDGHGESLQPGSYACLTVCDTGKGMDPATMDRIFEPFFTTKKVGQGTGLGLSVVHGIVRGHGGSIRVSSNPGSGTTFRILLPPAIPREVPASTAPVRVRGEGQRVLLLDDDVTLNRVLSRTLERMGYQVSSFDSPLAAIEALRRCPQDFDVVLTDYELPGMNGLAVSSAMMEVRPELPILLCSGYLRLELREKAEAMGIRGILSKPCDADAIGDSLAQALGLSAQAAPRGRDSTVLQDM